MSCSWSTLDIRVNDESVNGEAGLESTATFEISNIPKRFYSHFRIKMTGLNSSGRPILMIAGFEIYGYLREKA